MIDSSKDVENKDNQDKHQFWQNHVAAWEQSGTGDKQGQEPFEK